MRRKKQREADFLESRLQAEENRRQLMDMARDLQAVQDATGSPAMPGPVLGRNIQGGGHEIDFGSRAELPATFFTSHSTSTNTANTLNGYNPPWMVIDEAVRQTFHCSRCRDRFDIGLREPFPHDGLCARCLTMDAIEENYVVESIKETMRRATESDR